MSMWKYRSIQYAESNAMEWNDSILLESCSIFDILIWFLNNFCFIYTSKWTQKNAKLRKWNGARNGIQFNTQFITGVNNNKCNRETFSLANWSLQSKKCIDKNINKPLRL